MIENRIHLDTSTMAERDAEGFKKTAIHESGHATFQRLLITGEGWTEEANKATAAPDPRALDADGQRFYAAWLVLRARPQYFFVTDLPGGRAEATGPGRQGYLAGQFTEFCADSFMHIALKKDELEAHVEGLPDTEPAVKSAWETALSVLKKHEPGILGRHPRPDEAKVQARAYELYQRRGGGHRSREETEANYYDALREVETEERAHQIWKLRGGDPVANYYLAERQIAQGRRS